MRPILEGNFIFAALLVALTAATWAASATCWVAKKHVQSNAYSLACVGFFLVACVYGIVFQDGIWHDLTSDEMTLAQKASDSAYTETCTQLFIHCTEIGRRWEIKYDGDKYAVLLVAANTPSGIVNFSCSSKVMWRPKGSCERVFYEDMQPVWK